jgi:serine/threonine protein kinase
MGAVYQAWDAELGVAVALKVIRPEVMHDPAAAQDIERRFKQELLLARQVTHKNVVRIHDLGEIDGIKYITMPYIEGHDLASVLRSERLPVPKVMALARQVAAGLQAAHEAGVVHRDLKPANVMLEGEHAIIMDFGIARSTSRGGAAPKPAPAATPTVAPGALKVDADSEMTRIAETLVGEVIGTIEYMAPEQARGEHVDQRADVYAFGLILYDMLVGKRRSEHAVSAVGELQKRLAEPPPSIRTIIPASLSPSINCSPSAPSLTPPIVFRPPLSSSRRSNGWTTTASSARESGPSSCRMRLRQRRCCWRCRVTSIGPPALLSHTTR